MAKQHDYSYLGDKVLRDFIVIPNELSLFFKKRNKYVSMPTIDDKCNKSTAVTYSAIKGENAEPVPPEYFNDDKLMDTEEYEFTNMNEVDRNKADTATIGALNCLFGKSHYGNIRKRYMLGTSTTPIQVTFSENGKKSRKTLYVKRPDVNRVIGKFFYNIISGIDGGNYVFNRGVFLEEGIEGNVLSRINEDVYLSAPEYRKGLIRAAVHSDFLALAQDVIAPRNRIVNSKLQTVLFDFNLLFGPKNHPNENYIFNNYKGDRSILDKESVWTMIEEQHNIVRRIDQSHVADTFFKFARIAGHLVDATMKSTDTRLKEYYGVKSLEDYFERKIDMYRNA